MLNRNGFTLIDLIELMIVVIIVGILAAIAIPNFMSMQYCAKEAKVKGVAHTVQMIAEDYAVRHDGIYAAKIEDLFPLFPDDNRDGVPDLMLNAFTGFRTEPQFGRVAQSPGEVCYQPDVRAGVAVGYTITGYGANSDRGKNGIVARLTSD